MFEIRVEKLREEKESERYDKLNAELIRRVNTRTEKDTLRSLAAVLRGFGVQVYAKNAKTV